MKRRGLIIVLLIVLIAACEPYTSPVTSIPTVQPPAETPAPTGAPAEALSVTRAPLGASMQTRRLDGMVTVYVPAGDFLMGSAEDDADAGYDEKPQHLVNLDGFWIDRTEVSNAQYRQCVKKGACLEPHCWDNPNFSGADQPVVCVSWEEAQAYCQWVGGQLPTEAQWEKAARGTDGRRYPWGNQWDVSRCNSYESGIGKTVAVGSYLAGASPYGVLDMAGNAWEWVADWYDPGYYSVSPVRNPPGPAAGTLHVLRGGCWLHRWKVVRSAARSPMPADPSYSLHSVGFRCVQNATK